MTQKRYTEIPKKQKCINKEEPYIGGEVDIVDDTLDKPIYWNGTAWVDATGTPV